MITFLSNDCASFVKRLFDARIDYSKYDYISFVGGLPARVRDGYSLRNVHELRENLVREYKTSPAAYTLTLPSLFKQ